MPRPKRKRIVCCEPDYVCFRPEGILPAEDVVLSVDEFEVIRLVDHEKKTHEETARQMGVSRTTVTEIYESARYKLADSLVSGKCLYIAGGHYQLCGGETKCCKRNICVNQKKEDAIFAQKGNNTMRVAVTYENGNIFQHFGHTESFKLYDVVGGEIKESKVVGTDGNGHGALAGFLRANGVDALICGGIGGGAQAALAEAGIRLYGGVSGSADEAVQALIAGTLGYNPNAQCSHHGHAEGGHSCGSHGEGHSCGSHAHGEGHSCGGHGGHSCGNH